MQLIMLLIALPACAQVQVRFSPETPEVLRSMNVRRLGVWSVALCSDYSYPVLVPRERIAMAAGPLHLVEPVRALAVLRTRWAKSRKAVAAEMIEFALLGAAVLGGGGTIHVTTRVLQDLALATGVAHVVQDRLRGAPQDITAFTDGLLTDSVALAPAQCATRTVFSGLMHDPQPVMATIQVQ